MNHELSITRNVSANDYIIDLFGIDLPVLVTAITGNELYHSDFGMIRFETSSRQYKRVTGVEGPPTPADYVPGPEEPEQAPPSPVYLPYVPEPVYPEYIPPEDDEDDEEDPEEDPADYPVDRRDDDDDDDDEEEEEEHLAPADYTVVALPTVDHVQSEEETEPFKTDECAATPPSPLIPYSSPLPQIPSPPLPIPSPPPNSPTHIEVPESCLPLWKRLCFAAPTPNHEVGESSVAGAARQDGPAVA
ncbi:hypothetical protein Tco_0947905, partial [Tanacetum coccineum]